MAERPGAAVIRSWVFAAFGLAMGVHPAPGDLVPWQATFQVIAGEDWPWRAAQVKAESGFRLDARSPVGALGAAQVMPSTWVWGQRLGWVGPLDRPTELIPALTFQHRYMVWIHPRAGYDKVATNGAYNAGLGSVLKAKAHAKALGMVGPDAWLRALPAVTGHHARETQDYCRRIARFEADIRAGRRP